MGRCHAARQTGTVSTGCWRAGPRAPVFHMGLETEIVGPEEIAKMPPVTNSMVSSAGLYDPDWTGVWTLRAQHNALCPRRQKWAVHTSRRINGREPIPAPNGTWDVGHQTKATIHAEQCVNAGGLVGRAKWRRWQVSSAPLHRMEHQYEIVHMGKCPCQGDDGGRARAPHVMDPAGESYLRQEGMGCASGSYEQTSRPGLGRQRRGSFPDKIFCPMT